MTENSNETPQVEPTPKTEVAVDRVGDILRKERITRRIALETIARDLKLNVKYIKALEENRHDTLPAPPYIRVYLRSIAKYLQLNPEDIIKKFYEEIDTPADAAPKTGTTEKIDVSMQEKRNPNTRPYMTIAIIVGLIIFIIIVQKLGLISPSETQTTVTQSVIDSTALATASGDTVPPVTDPQSDDPSAFAEFDAQNADSFSLSVRSLKDSVWIQSFTDGVSWKNYLRAGRVKTFTAHDSINVHIGNNDITEYMYNGKPLKVKGNGATIFRVDRKGHTIWTVAHWNEVFKGRL